jgi:hypothetical protein
MMYLSFMKIVYFAEYIYALSLKTIIFESISRSRLPNNSKFSVGRMFSSCNSFRKRLFEHLYTKNIIDSPNCLCGEIESTHHYLFTCPIYTRQQNSLFRKLLQLLNIRPSENLLLFGSPDLDIDSNTILFMTVHKYISQRKPFLSSVTLILIRFLKKTT